MENEIKDKIERNKVKAELFLNNNIRTYIKDIYNTYYFCDILLVGEVYLYIYNFEGKRKGKKDRLVWSDISLISEYQPEKGGETCKEF